VLAAFLSGNSWETFSVLSVSSRHIPLNFYALLPCAKTKELSVHNAPPLLGRCIQNFKHFKPDYLIVGELSARRNPTNFKWRNNRGENIFSPKARERERKRAESTRSGLKRGCSVFAQVEEASNCQNGAQIED
jgi:hypothetical protein